MFAGAQFGIDDSSGLCSSNLRYSRGLQSAQSLFVLLNDSWFTLSEDAIYRISSFPGALVQPVDPEECAPWK